MTDNVIEIMKIMTDVSSLIVSAFALTFSLAAFFWQYLRRVDAAVCTLLSANIDSNEGAFQVALANIGTRTLLVRSIIIEVFANEKLEGSCFEITNLMDGALPGIIEAGKMTSWTLKTNFDELLNYQNPDEYNHVYAYFVLKVVAWNVNGKRLLGEKCIADFSRSNEEISTRYRIYTDRAFPVRLEKWGSKRWILWKTDCRSIVDAEVTSRTI